MGKGGRVETYSFTLILAGFEGGEAALTKNLQEAGCDDAVLGSLNGVLFLEFDREAVSMMGAILSAIHDVEGMDEALKVIRVAPDELVTAAEIADRTGRSRESIRLLAAGERGPGGFPPTMRGTTSRNRIWRWSEVATWMAAYDGQVDSDTVRQAHTIAAINGVLDVRRYAADSAKLLFQRLAF